MPSYQSLNVAFGRALGVTALANLSFFIVLLMLAQGDSGRIAARVRTAFATGELAMKDYRPFDARRGFHQYNDCSVLQMLTNKDSSSLLERALAPLIYYESEERNAQCSVLHALVVKGVDPTSLFVMRYTRYWHGPNVVAAVALRGLELKNARRMFAGAVWMAIGLLALAAAHTGSHGRLTGLVISFVAATVWAVPYFAPGLSDGPGDAILLIALAAIVAWPGIAVNLNTIAPYTAGLGATLAFLDLFTGRLPVAVAWLAAVTLAAGRDRRRSGGPPAPLVALVAVLAFGVAAAATVVTKQILAVTLSTPRAAQDFIMQMAFYMGSPTTSEMSRPGFLTSLTQLLAQTSVLTFGSAWASRGLVAATGFALVIAAVRGWRDRHTETGKDVLILIGAALIPAVWVWLLPLHTYLHTVLMVRILVVPIALAPLALWWPRGLEPGAREAMSQRNG
jgi:hypothetical protein